MAGSNTFASATDLASATSGTSSGDNTGYTKETGEPNPSATSDFKTAWWKWTAPSGSPVWVEFDTEGTGFDVVLSAWTGAAVNALTEKASNDDSAALGSDLSVIQFHTTPSTTYKIKIGSFGSSNAGPITLNWKVADIEASGNDDFADAVDLAGTTAADIHMSNVGATTEVDDPTDPYLADVPDQTVWLAWTCPGVDDLNVTVSSVRSAFAPVTDVFTGPDLASLTLVGFDNGTYIARFRATAGETYYIRVGSSTGSGDEGDIWLDFTAAVAASNDNDAFALARDLGADSGTIDDDNIAATTEASEPIPVNSGGDGPWQTKWFAFTPSEDGLAIFDTFGSDFDTVLAAYTGASLATLSEVASNDEDTFNPPQSSITFHVTGGTTYFIQVAGYAEFLTGTIVLNWTLAPSGSGAQAQGVVDGLPLT